MNTDFKRSYLYFYINDYTGNSSLSSYTLENTPLIFKPDLTTSDLLSGALGVSNKIVRWDFGDGTFSNNLTASHVYQWPGEYKVTLTILDINGDAYESVYSPTVKIFDFIALDYVFDDIGKLIYDVPASKIGDPLKILIQDSWQNYHTVSATGHTFSLYASGASGDYQNIDNFFNDKWSHLRLLSRFKIKQQNGSTETYTDVDTVTANLTEIYARHNNSLNQFEICSKNDEGSVFTGVTGEAEFYYVDDRAKNFTSRENPIFVFATPNNVQLNDKFTQYNNVYDVIKPLPAHFQNIKSLSQPIIKVRHNTASHLSITTTGIDGDGALSTTKFEMPEISWQCTPIPFVIKLKDFDNFTTKTYPPLSSMTVHSELSSSIVNSFETGIVRVTDNGLIPVTNVDFYDDFDDQIPQSTGGFYKGYFVSNDSAINCALTAAIVLVDPINFPKDALLAYVAVPQYSYLMQILKQNLYDSCAGFVSMTLTAAQFFLKTDANRNILAISVAPSGAGKNNDYQAWVADSTNDTILNYKADGTLLKQFRLSACPTLVNNLVYQRDYRLQLPLSAALNYPKAAAPSSLALDSKQNVWCALYETGIAIKIDNAKGYVTNIALPPYDNTFYYEGSSYNIPTLSGYVGESTLLPASVETDRNDNAWVAYTHPLSNFLCKYDTHGTLLTAIRFPNRVQPVEICADRDFYIWVTAVNNNTTGSTITAHNDFVYKFKDDGTLVPGYPLSGFKMIGNITVDGGQNAWVTHDKQTLTRIDAITRNTTHYIAGSASNQTSYIGSLVGLACDTGNYLWVVNNMDRKAYVIDGTTPPTTSFSFETYLDLQYPPVLSSYPLSSFETEQFQAYGDWFGQRWINKYMVPSTTVKYLTGISNTFNIYPSGGMYNIAKINEDYNLADFYKSIRHQEVLLDKEIFFDDFLGTIVGDMESKPYELGKTIYERIANFVSNKADISKCTLESLLSFCTEFIVSFENHNYSYPPQLRRVVDLLSIKHKHLYGDINTYNKNFDYKFTIPTNTKYGVNLGSEISPISGTIVTGKPVVAYEKFAETFNVVNDKCINNYTLSSVLPLSTFSYYWGWNLVAPPSLTGSDIGIYYKFYEINPTYDGKIYNNVINWDDPQTTLNYNQSSFDLWGKDNGIAQTLLSYELTKGLLLFTSAANITYNN
jgi:hypothetical protein